MTNPVVSTGKRLLTSLTHKIYELPVLILMPHSRCNCRCVMCDIWKNNQNKQELTAEDFSQHITNLKKLAVKVVVFSGGEALMHSNLWRFCALLKEELKVKITLLSTGLLLRRHAESVIQWCDEVIISIDGSNDVHNAIRNIPNAYAKMKNGIAALREIDPHYRITGRCVLQRLNHQDFPNIIDAAKDLTLDQISFLGADVSTIAFNRPQPLGDERIADIALTPNEVKIFEGILEKTIVDYASDFDQGFIAESRDKIRAIGQYYAALNGMSDFPSVRCNAPWVSAVIETNGDVQPCFFFPKIGNIFEQDLSEIVNSKKAIDFRKRLDVSSNPICRKCVCSLNLKSTAQL